MLTLGLDTSGELGSVALESEGGLVAESVLRVRATHSETVLPEVNRLLEAAGRDREEVEAVVVGAGPGSFTGLRIAASLAKGMCFATERRMYAYSSLAAVAAGTGLEGRVCAMFVARRERVYAGAVDGVEPVRWRLEPCVASVEEVLEALDSGREWCFAGQGALRHREPIEAAGGRVLPRHLGVPRASSLVWLARTQPGEGLVAEPATWEPEYLLRSSAERGVGA